MIRIRFHGRGGHGVKTASRIVGTAAFLAGYQVQDSPVYGAERRGAAVTAYTRIDREPILERGVIDGPDVIVIADETLLRDPAAAVLARQESASAVFLNSGSVEKLAEMRGITAPLFSFDLTACVLQTLGRASALSAGLGAAAARLSGLISADQLADAIREELGELRVSRELIEKNQQIARTVFDALPAVPFLPRSGWAAEVIHPVGYDAPVVGTSSIVAAGNAVERKTGAWRVERPEIDYDVCTRCGLCVLGCPDGAISLDREGYPVVDYDHCKGCMICAHVCPLQAIARTKEVPAW